MIVDTLENASSYLSLSPRIAAALHFLRHPESANPPLGRHAIDGDRVFALVQEYSTKPQEQCFWESHRKYIDVQFIQSGVESIGWSPIQQMKLKKDYEAEKDLMVWEGSAQMVLTLSAGSFAIFMPHDAHMPCLAAGSPQTVRKIVVKVAVE